MLTAVLSVQGFLILALSQKIVQQLVQDTQMGGLEEDRRSWLTVDIGDCNREVGLIAGIGWGWDGEQGLHEGECCDRNWDTEQYS